MRVAEPFSGPWIAGENKILIQFEQDKLLMGRGKDQNGKTFSLQNDHPVARVIAPGSSSPVPFTAAANSPTVSGNIKTYGFLIGRVDYVDAFDIAHWMKFCFVIYNAKGELANCKYGNDEDRNAEYPPQRK
jgi:hypothetical protein